MQIETRIIDTFTSIPFKGNPTAVCQATDNLDDDSMLSIAAEFNFPVTAFLKQTDERALEIRYFTPIIEIPACGHATLAAAKFLLDCSPGLKRVSFKTITGIIIEANIESSRIYLSYPVYHLKPFDIPPDLSRSVGVSDFINCGYSIELESLFLEVESSSIVRSIEPDYEKMKESTDEIKEIVIMSPSEDQKYDFVLRSFCPWIGINEDPVTGSIHSVLGPFWQKRLGKHSMTAYQASTRGGEVFVRVNDQHVELGGESVIVLKGLTSL